VRGRVGTPRRGRFRVAIHDDASQFAGRQAGVAAERKIGDRVQGAQIIRQRNPVPFRVVRPDIHAFKPTEVEQVVQRFANVHHRERLADPRCQKAQESRVGRRAPLDLENDGGYRAAHERSRGELGLRGGPWWPSPQRGGDRDEQDGGASHQ
jgi:hypothetical protein